MRDRALGSTIRLKFTTTDANGAPVAPSSAFVASDFRIYKDGSASEKATTNGITVTSPFDGVTGRHMIEIDTSNATGDAGFWSSCSAYFVELNTAKTVNSQSVSGLEIGSFSLELQTADVRRFGGTAITQSGGRPEVNVSHIGGDAQSLADLKDFVDAGYDPTTNKLTGAVELDSASLRRFVTEDTGETAAASGSVAKLAQGTGSLSAEQQEQLDLIEVACRGGQVVATTGFGIPDASGALLLKRGHTATITFTSATSNIVTDLSGSGKKVFFGVRTVSGNLLISGVQGEVLVATGLQSVRFTLTASQALALVAGVHLYDVVCVYGYDSNLDPPYASMEPFTGGYVRVQEVGVDLAEL